MPPKDLARLRHMLDSAQEASGLIKGKSRADLDRDRLLNLALVRLLEIIGEAASRVTNPTRIEYRIFPGRKSSASATGLFMVTMRLIWISCGRFSLMTYQGSLTS